VILTAADTREAVRALQRGRRTRRLHDLDWIEVLYKAYITAIVSLGTLFTAAAFVGDSPLGPATLDRVRDEGPAALGVFVAVGVMLGLRSGARGGPLALEPPDVNHVMLAPIDRATVLRAAALRQGRGVASAGVVGGALAGLLASQRVPGADSAAVAEWIVAGVLAGLATVMAVWGSALVASGFRLRSWVAWLVGGVLVGWSLADLGAKTVSSPTTMIGSVGLWPLEAHPLAVIGLVIALAVPVLGLRGIGGVSIEAAQRRSALVGALRFAATIQDLRTVIVLHRQLAQERSRPVPWLRFRRRSPVGRACWRRDWQGVLRWPLARFGRVAALGVAAGLCAYGTWRGTSPLILVGGIALYLAALDAIEPLAQEIDHPDRADGVPVERGALLVRHLVVPAVVMAVTGAIGLGAAAVLDPEPGLLAVGAITIVPVAVAASAAAALAVVLGAPTAGAGSMFGSPEAASVGLILRQAFPPLLAALAIAPVIAAREAAASAGGDPIGAAVTAAFPAVVIAAAVIGFIRTRKSVRF
jgi:hypothetical protein